jgi:hypothetical protein
MISELSDALRKAEAASYWTDPRRVVDMALDWAGIPADRLISTPNKRVAIVGAHVIKSASAGQIRKAVFFADTLKRDAAEVFDFGRVWLIQERVDPCDGPDVIAFARRLAERKAYDVRHNTGRRADGSLCAFDGFVRFMDSALILNATP